MGQLTALEARQQPYPFKLKLTRNTKRHPGRLLPESGWAVAVQGREVKDGELALMGWTDKRRVVVLRWPLAGESVPSGEADGRQVLA